MKITSISHFRKDIKRYVDEIDRDQEPLVITRADNVSVVVVPLATYNSYAETDYLLSNSKNAAYLRKSLKEAREGKVLKKKLIE